ncbi:MAG: Polypeptide-transport-associated domain protein FtsQ-type [Myxococcales bacterium]|nr:Polypeptide-transport-associated domain protein FtsQ-type [Myxococcales bacterium]
MLPKARPRTTRHAGWPFVRRRNRRIRNSSPALPRAPRPPLSTVMWQALARWRRSLLVAGVAVALAGGAWAGRWYVTHSHHFAVRVVKVSTTAHVSSEALITRAAVPLGVNLFAVDREEVARAVSQEPWVQRVHVRRELPSTLTLDVVERTAACAVALGSLYLSDAAGTVFKRATPEEAASLPVVTGLNREDWLAQPDHARAAVHEALQAIAAWRSGGHERAPVGEVHVDRIAGVTLYTDRGVGVRIGVVDETLADRLHRFDVVTAALAESGEEPRLVYVDNRARPDRVTVKLASAQLSAHSGNRD